MLSAHPPSQLQNCLMPETSTKLRNVQRLWSGELMMTAALILAEKWPGENQIHFFLFTLPSLFQRYGFQSLFIHYSV